MTYYELLITKNKNIYRRVYYKKLNEMFKYVKKFKKTHDMNTYEIKLIRGKV